MCSRSALLSQKIFEQTRFQFRALRLCNSSADMSVQTPFHLTNSYVHIGSASLSRRIMDPWHREIYKAKFENEYTDEKFMNGAKQAVMLSSLLIREKKFHELAPIMTETAVDYIREKANRISDDLLLEKLSFREENIVKAYILSSAFSSSKFFAMPRDALWTFYCTVVMVIDKKKSGPTKIDEAAIEVTKFFDLQYDTG